MIDNLSYLDETIILPTATGEIVIIGLKDMDDEKRKAVCDWAREHGIDPSGACGFLEIDRAARTIRYLAFDVKENGARFALPDGKHMSVSVRKVQLDRPIADFPIIVPPDQWSWSYTEDRMIRVSS